MGASWSREEREAYEQACLTETREQLRRVTSSDQELFELRDVRLNGEYPETRILVSLWDERYDKEVSRAYDIWRNSTFVNAKGMRESPYSVGMLVTTWSLGG